MYQYGVGSIRVAINFREYAVGHYLFLMDLNEVVAIDALDQETGLARVISLTNHNISDQGDQELAWRSRFVDLNQLNHVNCHLSERTYFNWAIHSKQ